MNPKIDKAILFGSAIILITIATTFEETQLLMAILAIIAFVYMALKYDALKEKAKK